MSFMEMFGGASNELRKINATLKGIHKSIKENQVTQQEKLNAIAGQISAGVSNIRQDIADLKARAPEDLDFSALEGSVQELSDLDTENPSSEPVVEHHNRNR